ncbi:DUF11 domain-containing protein [Actinocorallia longicatena]|uniref:DUF11 domain-containing protein n=1 Tax=Actinocorallia longicatena TaxID=111803 RepID=UPI0031DE149C
MTVVAVGSMMGSEFAVAAAPLDAPPTPPRVKLSKKVSSALAKPEETLTYTVKARNVGVVPVFKLRLVDRAPAGIVFLTASRGCALTPSRIRCSFAKVAYRSAVTVVITARVARTARPGTKISNRVVARYGTRTKVALAAFTVAAPPRPPVPPPPPATPPPAERAATPRALKSCLEGRPGATLNAEAQAARPKQGRLCKKQRSLPPRPEKKRDRHLVAGSAGSSKVRSHPVPSPARPGCKAGKRNGPERCPCAAAPSRADSGTARCARARLGLPSTGGAHLSFLALLGLAALLAGTGLTLLALRLPRTGRP